MPVPIVVEPEAPKEEEEEKIQMPVPTFPSSSSTVPPEVRLSMADEPAVLYSHDQAPTEAAGYEVNPPAKVRSFILFLMLGKLILIYAGRSNRSTKSHGIRKLSHSFHTPDTIFQTFRTRRVFLIRFRRPNKRHPPTPPITYTYQLWFLAAEP